MTDGQREAVENAISALTKLYKEYQGTLDEYEWFVCHESQKVVLMLKGVILNDDDFNIRMRKEWSQ